MARTVEDVLARHTRALFLNASAAIAMAEPVARLLAAELGRDELPGLRRRSEFLRWQSSIGQWFAVTLQST
jgi:glycerol-3-phosphate dehydrogenase